MEIVNAISAPPQVQSLYTNNTGEQLILTFDKAMNPPQNEAERFSLAVHRITPSGARQIETCAITQVERGSNTSQYHLTPATAIHNGDTATLTYTPGTIQSQDEGWLTAFTTPLSNVVEGDEPVVTSAVLEDNGTTISVRFSLKMEDAPDSKKNQFAVRADGQAKSITALNRQTEDPYVYVFSLDSQIVYGQSVTLSYTKGTIKAQYGSYLESFMDYPVQNTVAPDAPQVQSVQTNPGGDQLILTFDKAMQTPVNEQENFELTLTDSEGNAIETTRIQAVELSQTNNKQMILRLEDKIAYNQSSLLTYIPGNIQSQEGAPLAGFTVEIVNAVNPESPKCTHARINGEGTQIELTFDKAMKSLTTNQHTQFTVLVSGFENDSTSGQIKAGNNRIIILGLEKPIGKHNQIHVSYTKGTIQSTDGAFLESIPNTPVDQSALTSIIVVKAVNWQYSSIQEAIDSAVDGDQIIVYPGTYEESLDLGEKNLHITGTDPDDAQVVETTLINSYPNSPALHIKGGQNHSTIIEGLTITNGRNDPARPHEDPHLQSTVRFYYSSPIFRKNRIVNSKSTLGAIHVANSDQNHDPLEPVPVIISNEFNNNYGNLNGGGIFVDNYSLAEIHNNTFEFNSASEGGGIYIVETAVVVNADGKPWKPYNSPVALVAFVEGNTDPNQNNTYVNNTLIETAGARPGTSEGSDIQFGPSDTPAGTLTLRPETGAEQLLLTLNIDYTIGTEFHGGKLTIHVPTGFEIDANASVVIGNQSESAASDYHPTAQTIDITGINLETGTVTLKLAEQPIPSGMSDGRTSRDKTYQFRACADADGSSSAWNPTGEATAIFTSTRLSTNTDIQLKIGYPQHFIQCQITDSATVLKVASGTTVQTLSEQIQSTDGSEQTHEFYNSNSSLADDDPLTESATLLVTSQHGDTHQAEYEIIINATPFVKLHNIPEGSPISLRTYRGDSEVIETWHDTIADAVASANSAQPSTITVWPGRYVESLDLEVKPIHLTSTDPDDEQIKASTIIDGNENVFVMMIGSQPDSSARGTPVEGTCIIEGFTITNAKGGSFGVNERSDGMGCGVLIYERDAIIRNNIITENGSEGAGACGIAVNAVSVEVKIYDNHICQNFSGGGIYLQGNSQITDNTIAYNTAENGGGIFVLSGQPTITSNIIESNTAVGNGGGIYLETGGFGQPSRSGDRPAIFNNIIRNNRAEKGAGVYVDADMEPVNEEGNLWRRFNAPLSTPDFVEHNANSEKNNVYTGNILSVNPFSSRDGETEGTDIYFEGESQTKTGTFEVNEEIGTGTSAGQSLISATYTFAGFSSEGSITVHIPNGITIDESASVTIGDGETLPLSDEQINGENIFLNGITGTDVSIHINMAQPPLANGDYIFQVRSDADGSGTRYLTSDATTQTLTINGVISRYNQANILQERYNDLASAVSDAANCDVIKVISGTTLTNQLQAISISGKELTIQSQDGQTFTIDLQDNCRAFYISSNASVTVKNAIIKNALASNGYGGGIYIDHSALHLEKSTFQACQAGNAQNGGAIYSAYSEITTDNCTFIENTAQNGAGIAVAYSSTYQATNTHFNSNQAGAAGGGLYLVTGITATLTNCSVANNIAVQGGGIALHNQVTLTGINLTVNANTAVEGGGIMTNSNTTCQIIDSEISYNQSNGPFGGGGGIYLFNTSELTLTNSNISYNYAINNGGGICIDTSATATIHSNTINYNRADGAGGGIYIQNAAHRPNIVLNAEGEPWLLFDCPASNTADVEHNQTLDLNNDYLGNTIEFNGETNGAHIDFATN
ncbi:MAG TPA: SwmB domain-containing protein [Thermotogota bacterium]|nr:SwmB domain-containing protein [Thermotogota bacterium]